MISFVKVEYCSSLFYVNKSINEVSAMANQLIAIVRSEREREGGSDSVKYVSSEYVEQ